MIPEKGKTYEINYIPDIHTSQDEAYKGKADCLSSDKYEGNEGEPLYEFKLEDGSYALFADEDIIIEIP